jgi:hypothetical protein
LKAFQILYFSSMTEPVDLVAEFKVQTASCGEMGGRFDSPTVLASVWRRYTPEAEWIDEGMWVEAGEAAQAV